MTSATSTYFDYAAEKFDAFYQEGAKTAIGRWIDKRLRKSMRERFDRTFEVLQPLAGKTVLDIGCGPGRYTVLCGELGARRAVGIDFAPAMIELARQIARKSGREGNVEFIAGDYVAHRFSAKFDAAIVMGVFDYIAEPVAFVRKIAGDVAGTVVASFPVRYDLWALQRKLRYRFVKRCPLYFYSRRRIESILREAGITRYNIVKCHRDFVVDFQTP